MAQVIGHRITGAYHQGNLPWSRRKNQIPKKTWSGVVVYKKKQKREWNQSDIERITKKFQLTPPPDLHSGWQHEFILFLQELTIRMLEKILPFLSGNDVESLYYFVYELVGTFFNIDTSGYLGESDSIIFAIVERIASQGNYEITVKRR
jgi:hypothetical protein